MTALITGASSGIGEVFARKLAARGYDLILVARREDRLRQLAASLPGHAEVLSADLASEAGLAAVEQAIQKCAGLELLVNNAGFGTLGRFWEADIAGQVRMHEVHVMATMRLTHAALAGMVPRGRGGVISVSSVAAFGQATGSIGYCATKGWINSFKVTEFHQTLGMDRKTIPAFLWMKADDVVDASLKGFDRGKVTVVPNWKYKVAVVLLKYGPRALTRASRRPGSRRL